MYYYLDTKNKQCGPVSVSDLVGKGVTTETMVWQEGMTSWTRAKDVPELAGIVPPPVDVEAMSVTAQSPKFPKPNNNLVWGIVCAVACCLPLGAVAIYYSVCSDNAYSDGNYQKAESDAATAKKLSIIGIVVSAAFVVVYFILCFCIGLAGSLF